MTATDQAFIRAFDGDVASPRTHAPHVAFAIAGREIPDALNVAKELPAAPKVLDMPQTSAAQTLPPQPDSRPADTANIQPTFLPGSFRHHLDRREPVAEVEQATTKATVEREVTAPAESPTEDQPNRGSQRRPLSELIATPPPSNQFRPAFEVDAFAWADEVAMLAEQQTSGLDELLARMRVGTQSPVVILGTERSIGTTSTSLLLARLLATKERPVAIVDANFISPSVAASVGVQAEDGWESALLGGAPLAESVIHSLEDHVSIVPLAGPVNFASPQQPMLGDQIQAALNVLVDNFAHVIVDAGVPANQVNSTSSARSLFGDCATMLVCKNVEQTEAIGAFIAGTTLLGIIEVC